jgi:GT2 family glycosyltransferase
MVSRILVVIPVYGEQALTHAVLEDLGSEPERIDVTVVDNRGDYEPRTRETVLRPTDNLGWAGGTNHGTAETFTPEHDAVVWLNNDTRLAEGFIGGLVRCWQETGAGLVGPSYDCYWNHQRLRKEADLRTFRPRARHFRAPFVDGTCMFVPRSTFDAVGLLDADTFAPVGYGADFDYCLRVRLAGHSVVVTRLSYLHHEKQVTARSMHGTRLGEYGTRGDSIMAAGMTAKWGNDWWRLAEIDLETKQTLPLNWRRQLGRGPFRALTRPSASRFRPRLFG